MTRPINLKPGMFVSVINIREDEPEDESPMMFSPFGFGGRREKPTYNGKPWKVVAVSLPFVCLDDGQQRCGVDTRRITLQRISREYALAMDTMPRRGLEQSKASIFHARQPRPEKPDELDCPRCGNRMRQRLIKPGTGEWDYICTACETGRPATKVVIQ